MGNDLITRKIINNREFRRFIIKKKGKYIFNTRAIVEEELEDTFKDFCSTDNNGIFYMSEKYLSNFFETYESCFTMFNSTFIEYLFKFNEQNKKFNTSFFYFEIKAMEKSLVQFNITRQGFEPNGKVNFGKYEDAYFQIHGEVKVCDSIYEFTKNSEYHVSFHYENNPPEEILFWAPYIGQIELNFLGIKLDENDKNFNASILKPLKKIYKLTEKLGKLYNRKTMIESFISNVLNINIISEQESNGYYINFKEYGNVDYSFLTNKEKLKNIIDYVSQKQNLEYPEYVFKGTKYRITRDGCIYYLNSSNSRHILLGKINYNLFPQFIQERYNNNHLIVDVNRCRYDIEELKDLTVLNIRNIGPFEGQRRFGCHFHYLTKCITGRLGYFCDCCKKLYSNCASYYCSLCDFDLCGENCEKLQSDKNNKNTNSSWPDSIKSPSHNHPLILIKRFENRNNKYKCYSCMKYIHLNERVFYCTKCDFILCQRCKVIEQKGEDWQFKTHWHEHPLTLCTSDSKLISFYDKKEEEKEDDEIKNDNVEITPISDQTPRGKKNKCYGIKNDNIINIEITPRPDGDSKGEDYEFYFKCNHCGCEYPRTRESFYCTCCDFHICIKCYKNYFLFIGREEPNKIEVKPGNSFALPSYCRFLLEESKSFKCQKCNEKISNEWSYYCSNCNSKFCNNCYQFHKAIFDNNILIFDGNFANNYNFIKNGFGITFKRNNELNYKGFWINDNFDLIRNIPHEHGFRRGKLDDLQCKICKKMCNCYDPGISCSLCKINICDKCIIRINERLPFIINKEIKYQKKKNFFISIFSGCISEESEVFYVFIIRNCPDDFICNYCASKKTGIYFYKNYPLELICCIDCIFNN